MEAAELIDPYPVRPAWAGTREIVRGPQTRGSGRRRRIPHHPRRCPRRCRLTDGRARHPGWQAQVDGWPPSGSWSGSSGKVPAHSVGSVSSSRARGFREAANACSSDFPPSQKKRRWISPSASFSMGNVGQASQLMCQACRSRRTRRSPLFCGQWGTSLSSSAFRYARGLLRDSDALPGSARPSCDTEERWPAL
jgi:hypothetical protein